MLHLREFGTVISLSLHLSNDALGLKQIRLNKYVESNITSHSIHLLCMYLTLSVCLSALCVCVCVVSISIVGKGIGQVT